MSYQLNDYDIDEAIKNRERNYKLFLKIVGENPLDQIDWIIENGLDKFNYWFRCYETGLIYSPATVEEYKEIAPLSISRKPKYHRFFFKENRVVVEFETKEFRYGKDIVEHHRVDYGDYDYAVGELAKLSRGYETLGKGEIVLVTEGYGFDRGYKYRVSKINGDEHEYLKDEYLERPEKEDLLAMADKLNLR